MIIISVECLVSSASLVSHRLGWSRNEKPNNNNNRNARVCVEQTCDAWIYLASMESYVCVWCVWCVHVKLVLYGCWLAGGCCDAAAHQPKRVFLYSTSCPAFAVRSAFAVRQRIDCGWYCALESAGPASHSHIHVMSSMCADLQRDCFVVRLVDLLFGVATVNWEPRR